MLARLPRSKSAALETAQYIRDHGHCKKRLVDEATGAVCIMGGLRNTLYGNARNWASSKEEEAVICEIVLSLMDRLGLPPDQSPTYFHSIVTWNNAPERTAEDVVRALEDYALAS